MTPIKSLQPPNIHLIPFSESSLEYELLRSSIEADGLLCPLVVCNGMIVDGFRRWTVCRGMGWTEIPTHNVTGDPDALRITCQTRHTTIGKTEKKILLGQILESNPGTTAAAIAHQLKWSPIEIEELVGIQYLCPAALTMYRSGTLPLSTAWHMARLVDHIQLRLMDEGSDALFERSEAALREVRCARRRSVTTSGRVKGYNAVQKERDRPSQAGPALIAADAKTPLDGWVAALSWVLSTK